MDIIIAEKEINSKLEKIKNIYNKIYSIKNEDKINNKIIKKEYEDGKYEGELRNSKREGKGKFYYNDGEI